MGVFGSLWIEGEDQQWFTVERPWVNNEPNISCIPPGDYPFVPRTYNRGGYEAYEVTNVTGRSLIMLHKGNTMDDLQGCIAPGLALGVIKNTWAVVSSATAFQQIMNVLDDGEHEISIAEIKL